MDYLIDSITEFYKNKPFSLDDVDIIPYKYQKVPSVLKGQPPWNKGISPSTETRQKISAYQKIRLQNGQPESQRLAAKEAMSKTTKIQVICEKCGKITNLGNHKRWHGDKCGIKQTHSEETKQKISNTSKGRTLSEKCRLAIIDSNKKRKGKKYPNGYKTKDKVLDFS